jgi:integrase
MTWMKASKYYALTGLTHDAVHACRRQGLWKDGIHCRVVGGAHLRKAFWKPLLARAGVRYRYRYPYQCRHTFATGLLKEGTPIAFVSQYLGHTTIEMTMRHYIRFSSEVNLPTNRVTDWSYEPKQE